MRTLRQARDDSRALRPAMGCTWREARRLFPHCVACLEPHGAACLTTPWAVQGATPPCDVRPAEWAGRLRVVRGLAQLPQRR